jgi:hypothetical protein
MPGAPGAALLRRIRRANRTAGVELLTYLDLDRTGCIIHVKKSHGNRLKNLLLEEANDSARPVPRFAQRRKQVGDEPGMVADKPNALAYQPFLQFLQPEVHDATQIAPVKSSEQDDGIAPRQELARESRLEKVCRIWSVVRFAEPQGPSPEHILRYGVGGQHHRARAGIKHLPPTGCDTAAVQQSQQQGR